MGLRDIMLSALFNFWVRYFGWVLVNETDAKKLSSDPGFADETDAKKLSSDPGFAEKTFI